MFNAFYTSPTVIKAMHVVGKNPPILKVASTEEGLLVSGRCRVRRSSNECQP